MEQLHNGFTLEISPGAFPLSTDSIALAEFAHLHTRSAVLDLGSGCGTLGLLLCANYPDCTVTGVELTETAHSTTLKNAKNNKLEDRLFSICEDIANIPKLFPPGSMTCCISNPPYFTGGPESKQLPLARREDRCSIDTLMSAAQWALKYGGDFFLIHRPERLAELFISAGAHQLEPKRLRLLRHRCDGPVSLVMIQFRKGGKPGLNWEEVCLFDSKNNPTPYYKQLYHL